MKVLAKISLLLVIVLVSLSAYLRLSHSGIGCADWPACYGRIGDKQIISQPLSTENAYRHIVAEASQPLAWATPLHRLVASVLGLLVLFLVMLAFRQKNNRSISLLLLFITVYLALLGLKSGGLHSPGVVMGNLAGGFGMLGLLGWMVFRQGTRAINSEIEGARVPLPRYLLWGAIILLVCQITMGGLTSANFAATSCLTLPDCHGSWVPGREIWKAMDLSADHEVTSTGQVIGGQERAAIHKAHRVGAVATLISVLLVGLMAWRCGSRLRLAGVFVVVAVTLEFAIGIASVWSGLPIGLAVAHNWLAGLVLLGMLRILVLNLSSNGS